MKLTINTAKLQEMVSKAIKGASNNKMIPLTGLISIELKENKLVLQTTDATNYLYIVENEVAGEDFRVVVEVDTFAKLISRMTSDNITLELTDSSLKITGNGTYNMDLPLDENGTPIVYPNPIEGLSIEDITVVNRTTIQMILDTAKSALAVTLENPCYTGYYVGENVVATDTYKICGINIPVLDSPMLISPEMMNLLEVMTEEKIEMCIVNNKIIFNSSNCMIYGSPLDGIEDYSIDAINGLLTSSFDSVCTVPKSQLLQALDRLSLFVGTYDKNGIYITFTQNGLNLSSKQSNGIEDIEYKDSKNFNPFTCCIDVEMLKSQIKAQTSDIIEIWYGEDNAIKMVDGNVTQIVALLEDDRM